MTEFDFARLQLELQDTTHQAYFDRCSADTFAEVASELWDCTEGIMDEAGLFGAFATQQHHSIPQQNGRLAVLINPYGPQPTSPAMANQGMLRVTVNRITSEEGGTRHIMVDDYIAARKIGGVAARHGELVLPRGCPVTQYIHPVIARDLEDGKMYRKVFPGYRPTSPAMNSDKLPLEELYVALARARTLKGIIEQISSRVYLDDEYPVE